MATSSKTSLFSSTDLQFLLTFVMGMAGFWLSANLLSYLPRIPLPQNSTAAYIIGLIMALLIYGALMFAWSFLILGSRRSLKSSLTAAVICMVLALLTSLGLTWLNLHGPSLRLELLVFGIYVVYGAYYVIAWAVARKLAS